MTQEDDAALAVFPAGGKLRQRVPDPERPGAGRRTGPHTLGLRSPTPR